MENENEAHSSPVKIETLDKALSESQAVPPFPLLAFHLLAPESGYGNLDLPPSPPPLPLVSESVVPEPEGNVGDLGYVSDVIVQARMRFRLMKSTAKGISMVKTPGQKAYGLLLLECNRDILQDLGHIVLFRAMLEKAGLPSNLECIDISDDYPDQYPSEPEVWVPRTIAEDVMAGLYHSLSQIVIDGRNLGDVGEPSGAEPSGAKPSRAV